MIALRLRRVLMFEIAALTAQALAVAGDAAPPPVVPAPPHQIVTMRRTALDDAAHKLGQATCQWLEPCDAPQKRLRQEPKYRSNRPIYYAARFGDAQDSLYALVLDEGRGPGKGYDTLYIDADHDGRIDAQKERFPLGVGDSPQGNPIHVRLQVTSGGVTAPYDVSLTAFRYCDAKFPVPGIHVTLRGSSCYLGEAVLGGRRRKIAVADLNSNGLFNDVEQDPFQGDRFYVAPDEAGQFYQSFPGGKFTQIMGQWYSIVVSPDGGRVEITAAQPPLGRIEAPEQIVGARLNSPAQPLDLDFQDGSDRAVAGTYRVHSVQLLADSGWALGGTFPDGEPELTVRQGQTVRLAAGLPLKVQPEVVSDEDRTLRISLRITGAGGETYRWTKRRGSSSQAGFEIFDASGQRIASGGFEYG
jgi:hypothetical protein